MIVITGTSSGIGYHLASKLSHKYNLYGISRKSPEDLDISFISADLSSASDRNKTVATLLQAPEAIEAIILNAGVGYFDAFENIPWENQMETLETNLIAPMHLLYALAPKLSKNAKIIFIGSRASRRFMKDGAAYQASKFGLRGFAGAIKNEWKDKRVHFINPSIVETDFFKNSKVSMQGLPTTTLEEIEKTVRVILDGKEERFEIDL